MVEPTFTFTIPSIHDETTLECRVYTPPHSVLNSTETEWRPRAAVVTHPYSPMGGCFDDNVVLSIVAELLKQCFVVGTFNFRGAGSSKGSTSWSGKGELNDYISFVAFVVHYIHRISFTACETHLRCATNTKSGFLLEPHARQTSHNHNSICVPRTILVLAGYSYGSLIASHLPKTEAILQSFRKALKGTAKAEIILRAASLSSQWNKEAEMYRQAQHAHRSEANGKSRTAPRMIAVAIGGDESEAGSRRSSHEMRRSVDKPGHLLGVRQDSHSLEILNCNMVEGYVEDVEVPLPQTRYLLVSPLLPPISMLATMSFRSSKANEYEEKLSDTASFAIYGNNDFFTSHTKLRRWAEGLKARPGSMFQFHEVQGAGHFWREEGCERQLRSNIGKWIRGQAQLD